MTGDLRNINWSTPKNGHTFFNIIAILAASIAKMMMRTPEIIGRVALATIAVVSAPVHAAVVLDQHYDFTSGVAESTNGNVSEVGQTFTVGKTGTLDHFDVLMFRLGGIFDPTTDPVLSVYNTSGGLPAGAPIAVVSVSRTLVPNGTASFVSFDVSSSLIPVSVGDVLAFSISTSGSGPYFLLEHSDTGLPSDYASGEGVSRILNIPPDPWQTIQVDGHTTDFGFSTYVNTPPDDVDGDGVADTIDNCINVANSDQQDTDSDGYGNGCDADFNQNGVVDSTDLSDIKAALRTTAPDKDLNGNGVVDSTDFSIAKGFLRQPPGPSCCGITLPP